MSISLLLSVLTGLIFTWFLLSLAILNIQEWVASRGKWRAHMLEKAIGKMLGDEVYLTLFYKHPLITSLFTGKNNTDKPSYIPASEFSQVMLDLLASAGTEASLLEYQLYKLLGTTKKLSRKTRKTADHRINLVIGMARKALVSEGGEEAVASIMETARNDLLSLQQKIKKLQAPIDQAFADIRQQKQEINDALVKFAYQQEPSASDTVNQVRAGIVGLSIAQPRLKQTLYPFMQTAAQSVWQKENELELIRTNIEAWFNHSMNRVTGWYKRRTMVSTFIIGLLLAFCLNADSLNIADRIWNEPKLRALILEQVNGFIANNGTTDTGSMDWQAIAANTSLSGLPFGWVGNLMSEEDATGAGGMVLEAKNCSTHPSGGDQTYGLWVNQDCYQIVNTPLPGDSAGWLLKALGLFVTALASSQGAPIWFDLLKKIVNIRLTGLKPAETTKAFG